MGRRKTPDTLTINEKRFVQVYDQTGNASEAFRQAYGKSKDAHCGQASAILTRPTVQAELRRLQYVRAMTPDQLARIVSDAIDVAKERKNAQGIAQNARLLADLRGWIVQKQEQTVRRIDRVADWRNVKTEEIRDQLLNRLKLSSAGIDPTPEDPPPVEVQVGEGVDNAR